MSTNTTAPTWTVDQLSEHWQCSPFTIRRMISRGDLRAIRIGRLIRIRHEDVTKAGRPVTKTVAAGGGAA